MGPAFIERIGETLSNTAITFDKFRAVRLVNDAVDQVRREEQKKHGAAARHPPHLTVQPGNPVGTPTGHA